MIKKLSLIILLIVGFAFNAAADDIKREHRAVWMTAFLGEWPSGSLDSESAVKRQTRILEAYLDSLQHHNLNTVYFHVRSHCDAMYKSAYEPWAACVAGTRGTTAPLIDPLETIIEKCHERGIELYAWFNPYRYSADKKYGSCELNYENSHPDWLLTVSGKETILNPGLPEVRQRVVDVCRDVVVNYDVDGVIFDDYFYTNGTSMDKDANLYNAYKAAGGTLAQADWRRENVNLMIRGVRDMIAETKPYLNFVISPAGACNPTNIADYGLPASTMSDWQYNGIYSDPVAWLHQGIIDMVSPQVYKSLASTFKPNSEWWIMVANHFGRNISVSTSMSNVDDQYELPGQVEYVRTQHALDHSGLSIFGFNSFQIFRKDDPDLGKTMPMGWFLKKTVYNTPVLNTIRPWRNNYEPRMVSDIKVQGSTVTWTAAREGDRYSVYDLTNQKPELMGVTYTNSYTLPEKHSGKVGVCVYDRYGNEYSMLEAGKTATAGTPPVLTYPANGDSYAPLSKFTWTGNATNYTVVIKEGDKGVLSFDTEAPELNTASFVGLDQNKTYTWQVLAKGANTTEAASEVRTFKPAKMAIITPAAGASDVAECAQFTVTKAADGAKYTIEISTLEKFNSIAYSATFDSNTFSLPQQAISTGVTYYARVTADYDGHSMTSPVSKFTTATVEYTDAPTFLSPLNPGETMYSDSPIIVEPWHGLNGVVIEISETDAFPTRGATAQSTLIGFTNATKALGEWKISSKPLVDGKTYYLRARGRFMKNGKSTGYTPYSPVLTFKYSAETGSVDQIESDATPLSGNVYNLQGILIKSDATPEQINALPAGLYIINGSKVLIK